jgi:ribonuclease HII
MLLSNYSGQDLECGCDEVGRGCIAGPVVAAAVILPKDYKNELIKDSKKLSEKQREHLYDIIIKDSIDYSIAQISESVIDRINILQASILAMQTAISKLKTKPDFILVDGNQFNDFNNIPYECIIKGDGKYLSIAAASILAKVYRDRLMKDLDDQYPMYEWKKNKGYPTKNHKLAVKKYGHTQYHRLSFKSI